MQNTSNADRSSASSSSTFITKLKSISLYVMALFYFLGGLNHFRDPEFYLKMMPPYLPLHNLLNQLSGLAEIALALLLLPQKTRRLAAFGILLLLIAIFPANIYMYQTGTQAYGLSQTLLLLRLPIQGVFLLWAYWHTRPDSPMKSH